MTQVFTATAVDACFSCGNVDTLVDGYLCAYCKYDCLMLYVLAGVLPAIKYITVEQYTSGSVPIFPSSAWQTIQFPFPKP